MKTPALVFILLLLCGSAAIACSNDQKATTACNHSVMEQDFVQEETMQMASAVSSHMSAMVLQKLQMQPALFKEARLLDQLQQETQSISILKPLLVAASFMEKRIGRVL